MQRINRLFLKNKELLEQFKLAQSADIKLVDIRLNRIDWTKGNAKRLLTAQFDNAWLDSTDITFAYNNALNATIALAYMQKPLKVINGPTNQSHSENDRASVISPFRNAIYAAQTYGYDLAIGLMCNKADAPFRLIKSQDRISAFGPNFKIGAWNINSKGVHIDLRAGATRRLYILGEVVDRSFYDDKVMNFEKYITHKPLSNAALIFQKLCKIAALKNITPMLAAIDKKISVMRDKTAADENAPLPDMDVLRKQILG